MLLRVLLCVLLRGPDVRHRPLGPLSDALCTKQLVQIPFVKNTSMKITLLSHLRLSAPVQHFNLRDTFLSY